MFKIEVPNKIHNNVNLQKIGLKQLPTNPKNLEFLN